MARKKPQVQEVERVGGEFLVQGEEGLAYKLSLKGTPYTCKTLARSVAAGTITQAQAEAHHPRFASWAKSRKTLGLPIDASPKAVAAAKPKEGKKATPAKAAAAEKSTPKAKAVSKSKAARLSKAELLARMTEAGLIA